MSLAVITPTTPGMFSAFDVSMDFIFAWCSVLLTTASSSASWSLMSAENGATPHAFNMAEGRGWDTPIFGPFGSGLTLSGVVSPRINLAASITASMILAYPVQRQRLCSRAFFISALSGFGLRSRRAFVAMIIPGVQNPHCTAPDRTYAS